MPTARAKKVTELKKILAATIDEVETGSSRHTSYLVHKLNSLILDLEDKNDQNAVILLLLQSHDTFTELSGINQNASRIVFNHLIATHEYNNSISPPAQDNSAAQANSATEAGGSVTPTSPTKQELISSLQHELRRTLSSPAMCFIHRNPTAFALSTLLTAGFSAVATLIITNDSRKLEDFNTICSSLADFILGESIDTAKFINEHSIDGRQTVADPADLLAIKRAIMNAVLAIKNASLRYHYLIRLLDSTTPLCQFMDAQRGARAIATRSYPLHISSVLPDAADLSRKQSSFFCTYNSDCTKLYFVSKEGSVQYLPWISGTKHQAEFNDFKARVAQHGSNVATVLNSDFLALITTLTGFQTPSSRTSKGVRQHVPRDAQAALKECVAQFRTRHPDVILPSLEAHSPTSTAPYSASYGSSKPKPSQKGVAAAPGAG
jgi:hypothetical protein